MEFPKARRSINVELAYEGENEEYQDPFGKVADAIPTRFEDLINVPGSSGDYLRGIDISHYNTINDWNALKKAGIVWIYIKISEGVGTPDQMAQTFALLARQYGFKIGYYHFGRPDAKVGGLVTTDALAEANEVINIQKNLPVADLPLMLDLEEAGTWDTPLNKANYLLWVETFLEKFYNPLKPGLSPLIYSRQNYLNLHLPANHQLAAKYRLWLAKYTDDYATAIPANGWKNWLLWQFTESGIIGNNSVFDLNLIKK